MSHQEGGTDLVYLTKGRLEGLSDGIFAFAMTLLVIGLSLPDKTSIIQTETYAYNLLTSLHSDFFHYILAFLILGAFWVGHHIQISAVKKIDRAFVWINLMILLFVALLPFSTSFSGDFPKVPLGAIVFEANLFAIGSGQFLLWIYATSGFRLVEPDVLPGFIRNIRVKNLLVPGVSVVGILIALAGNTWSNTVYLTLPILGVLTDRFVR